MTSKMPRQAPETVAAVWLNETQFCTLDDLAQLSGLSLAELKDLISVGVIEAKSTDDDHVIFQQHYVVVARTAKRLRDDFELDHHGLAVAVHLLQRIQELEGQLSSAQAQLMHGRLSSDAAGDA